MKSIERTPIIKFDRLRTGGVFGGLLFLATSLPGSGQTNFNEAVPQSFDPALQSKSALSIPSYDTQPTGESLQSAYLLRSLADQQWGDGQRPSLQAHFSDALRILQSQTEQSLRLALDRLQLAREGLWTKDELETWRRHLSEERKRNIAALHEYQARGLFPVNDVDPSRSIPIFVDRYNTACAVGYLMLQSGAVEAVEAIVQDNNLVYVTDVDTGPMVDWVLSSGLTQEEAALIQPGYNPGLSWHNIDPPLEEERQIESLVFSSFHSEFVADPEIPEGGYGTSGYSVAVAPDSRGNGLPGEDSALLASFPLQIGIEGATWPWPDPLVQSSESRDTGHFKTYEFVISPVEFEGFNQLAVSTKGVTWANSVGLESTDDRIQIDVSLYDPMDRLIGELSFDSAVPGDTVMGFEEIVMSAEDAVEFATTGSIRVVTSIRLWGKSSVYSLAYGLNPVGPKLKYEIVGDSVTVTGFSKIASGTITIPSEIEGLPVTQFEPSLLYNANVTTIVLPSTLSVIGEWAFLGFPGLESIIVAPENTKFASLDGVLFNSSMSSLIRCPRGKGGSYSIPAGIVSIQKSAFVQCGSLNSVSLPETLEDIGYEAFRGCSSLTGVTIPNSVARIGAAAFRSCALENVTIGSSVTSIGDSAFDSCASLKNIVIPDSVSWMGNNVFAGCRGLTSVTVGAGLTRMGGFVFAHCVKLERVYFEGDLPADLGGDLFFYIDPKPTVFHRDGISSWEETIDGAPTALWDPRIWFDNGMFDEQTSQISFTIMGAVDVPVAVETCLDLANPIWTKITHLTCGDDGTVQFTDPEVTDQPSRYYRFRPE